MSRRPPDMTRGFVPVPVPLAWMTRHRLVPVVTILVLLFQHHLLVSTFVVLPQSRCFIGIEQPSGVFTLDSFAAAPALRASSTFQSPVLGTTRHANNGICSRCMVTMTSEIHASPRWEGFWSAGLKKGDMWDTGCVSPALQNLLDEGEYEVPCTRLEFGTNEITYIHI